MRGVVTVPALPSYSPIPTVRSAVADAGLVDASAGYWAPEARPLAAGTLPGRGPGRCLGGGRQHQEQHGDVTPQHCGE